jgi:hypothetical protein
MVAVLGPYEALPYYIHTYIRENNWGGHPRPSTKQTEFRDFIETFHSLKPRKVSLYF